MGRRTWDSLPDRFRPLPGRRNVVITRNERGVPTVPSARRRSTKHCASLEGTEQVFVIGGAEIYASALPRANELVLTEIDRDVEGDVRFPDWDRGAFLEVARKPHIADDGTALAWVTYARGDGQ